MCALSRALPKDIDAAAEALKVADQFRIHTFLATSTIHVENKLKKSFEDVLEMGVNAVKYARRFTDDVEFSCEDAGRTPIDNFCAVWSKPPSMPAPVPSIFRIPWVTPFRLSSVVSFTDIV